VGILTTFGPPPSARIPSKSHLSVPNQPRERGFCKQEVTGSIPVGSIAEVPADQPLQSRLAEHGVGHVQALGPTKRLKRLF
jgi:hypothetical protein